MGRHLGPPSEMTLDGLVELEIDGAVKPATQGLLKALSIGWMPIITDGHAATSKFLADSGDVAHRVAANVAAVPGGVLVPPFHDLRLRAPGGVGVLPLTSPVLIVGVLKLGNHGLVEANAEFFRRTQTADRLVTSQGFGIDAGESQEATIAVKRRSDGNERLPCRQGGCIERPQAFVGDTTGGD